MKRLRSLLAALLVGCACSIAANPDPAFEPLTANIEENIATPAVPDKQSAAVTTAMGHLVSRLRESGYHVDAVRKGEVVMVTIQCAKLFAPNSTTLLPDGTKLLAGLAPYIQRSDNYKVILAVHTDNTGDDIYSEKITADRANAIDEYYYRANGNHDTDIIPYGLGSDEPVAPNTGMANREKNRRVEIYFVPTQQLIDKIRNKK